MNNFENHTWPEDLILSLSPSLSKSRQKHRVCALLTWADNSFRVSTAEISGGWEGDQLIFGRGVGGVSYLDHYETTALLHCSHGNTSGS